MSYIAPKHTAGVAFLWHPVSVSVRKLLHTAPIFFTPILFGAEAV